MIKKLEMLLEQCENNLYYRDIIGVRKGGQASHTEDASYQKMGKTEDESINLTEEVRNTSQKIALEYGDVALINEYSFESI